MRLRIYAAAGAFALAAAAALPAGPAHADSVRDSEWYLKTLKVSQAHAITKGAGVTVGVVDTGVYPHPDLKNNLLKGKDIVKGGNGVGQVDRVGHGTGVATLIAGHGRGPDGVLGIAPEAKILPIMYTSSQELGGTQTEYDGDSAEIAKGISEAVDAQAEVINVSSAAAPTLDLTEAVAKAVQKDVLVVAGSGNDGKSKLFGYPAPLPGVLAVGAIDGNGKHADFSVSGPHLKLCAPGTNIEAARPESTYKRVRGTSLSTAIVSGAAALVRAKFPDLTAPQVTHRLTATADDIGPPGRDDQCGYGVLNIVKALTADVPDDASATAPSAPTANPSAASSPATPAITKLPQAEPAAETSNAGPIAIGLVVGALLVVGAIGGIVLARRRP